MTNPHDIFNASSVTHRGKPLSMLSPSVEFSNFIENMDNNDFKVAIIPEGMDGRPDLLAYQVYGTSDLWWAIMLANRIEDATTQLVTGKKVFIPYIPGIAFVID